MNLNEAQKKVEFYLRGMHEKDDFEVIINQSKIKTYSFGWVFPYNTREFIETGNYSKALAGNIPIVVTKMDGALHRPGNAYTYEEELRKFEHYDTKKIQKWKIMD